jgi:hypothetical protein
MNETCRVLYQNKLEKYCISLAFIMRIYHDARSSECQLATHSDCNKFSFASAIRKFLKKVFALESKRSRDGLRDQERHSLYS